MNPFVMVIFGATGDLARNKLVPALFSLYKQKLLPKDFFIYGFARRNLTTGFFHDLYDHLKSDKSWPDFAARFYYQQGKFEEDKGYFELMESLKKIDEKLGFPVIRLFYLATPPIYYDVILDKLKSTGLAEGFLNDSSKLSRIIIEKPFGKDLEHAKLLDKRLSEMFEEKQIFRVDHYLAKDTVQNIIAFRFANGIFESIWNKDYVDHVQITLAEKEGIGSRGKFYDGVGHLRDVAQNHLLQLMASVVMEQPYSFTSEAVRDARASAIKSIICPDFENITKNVVRGQYESYRRELDVAPDSTTETFVAMKLFVNTKRFSNVPFYLRAGKKMRENRVEISLVFKQVCHILFKEYGCPEIGNILSFKIQPNEGINLKVIAKRPGASLSLATVDMKFSYFEEFGWKGVDAYEKLLLDIFSGDQMLFNRSDELESSWQLITQILQAWSKQTDGPSIYQDNTMGPKEAEELIEKDGRKWL